MEESARVLSRAAGPLSASLMFIGEAPGRLGADSSGIPFHGDQAGHNFEDLLSFVGLDRSKVFITNAVLCNPRSDSGNNATPSRSEIANCSNYLREQIDLVRPRVVATLGAVALEATRLIQDHLLQLAAHVRTSHRWYGRLLVPLYHPGARALVHRSAPNQRSDFQFLAEQIRRIDRQPRATYGVTRTDVLALVRIILNEAGGLSYFALHKLLYLVEWKAFERTGRRLTSAFFLRQKDGPYCTDIHLARLKRAFPTLVVGGGSTHPTLHLPPSLLPEEGVEFALEDRNLVREIVAGAIKLSDAELKTRAYLTKPLRMILRAERARLVNLYNTPITFSEGVTAQLSTFDPKS